MTILQSLINNYFAAEEKRLARLKIFCAAMLIDFYSANEEICGVVNRSCLSIDEVQERFIAARSANFKEMDLGVRGFWDLYWYRRHQS